MGHRPAADVANQIVSHAPLGSARVSRAGDRILRSRTLSAERSPRRAVRGSLPRTSIIKPSRRATCVRQAAERCRLVACAPQSNHCNRRAWSRFLSHLAAATLPGIRSSRTRRSKAPDPARVWLAPLIHLLRPQSSIPQRLLSPIRTSVRLLPPIALTTTFSSGRET